MQVLRPYGVPVLKGKAGLNEVSYETGVMHDTDYKGLEVINNL